MNEKVTQQIDAGAISFPKIGEMFGSRYHIVRILGQGGMGNVFLAHDLELNEEVALKIIRPELGGDASVLARFRRELQLAREINSDHVIRIHDIGDVHGIRFISMKYIHGSTLNEILAERNHLPAEEAATVARQIGLALQAAHRKGIVHRDLKPHNVMVEENGNVVVLDFGIARSLDTASLTESGTMLGTPRFMSPEQVRGGKVDQRSDIWSLGVIFYEMLTGQPPFRGSDRETLFFEILSSNPLPPSQVNPSLGYSYDSVVERCLAKDPKKRYESAENLLADLTGNSPMPRPATEYRTGNGDVRQKGARRRLKTRRIPKYLAIPMLVLFTLYTGISVMSFIVDEIYKGKLKELAKKRSAYFASHFPIKKTWLPKDWDASECNAWETYQKLFPSKNDIEQNRIPKPKILTPDRERLMKYQRDFDYESIAEIRSLLNSYGALFDFDALFKAARCSQLTHPYWQDDRLPNLLVVLYYTRMMCLKVRYDFLTGNYHDGMVKLIHYLVFVNDLFAASVSLIETNIGCASVSNLCVELIPLLISKREKIDFQDLDLIRTLLGGCIEKINKIDSIQKDSYNFCFLSADQFQTRYFLFGKIRYWRDFFSFYRCLYLSYGYVDEVLGQMKYIRNEHDKTVFFKDLELQRGDRFSEFIGVNRLSLFKYDYARTLGKVVLLLIKFRTSGFDLDALKSFVEHEGILNDITGKSFRIVESQGHIKLFVDQFYSLDIDSIDYAKEYKLLAKSITAYFSGERMDAFAQSMKLD